MHLMRRTSSRRTGGAGAWNGDRNGRNHPHRSSSRRKNKENGSRPGSFKINRNHGPASHLRNSANSTENVLRRNSKASGDSSVLLDIGRRSNEAVDDNVDCDEEEQSQKKQRIVMDVLGSTEKIAGDSRESLMMDMVVTATMTTTTTGVVGSGGVGGGAVLEASSDIPLHRPPPPRL